MSKLRGLNDVLVHDDVWGVRVQAPSGPSSVASIRATAAAAQPINLAQGDTADDAIEL